MNILIYGPGGIGGFLGAFLLKSDFQTFFLARGDTYKILNRNGMALRSNLGDIQIRKLNVINSLKKCPEVDIVILAVKLYDLNNSLEDLVANARGDFVILPFQNGVIAEILIRKKFGEEKTFGGVAQISSFLNENKEIIHNGNLASFFVGKMSTYSKYEKKIIKFSEEINNLGIDFRYSEKIKQKIWDKFIFLSAYSGVTTLSEMTIGEIFDDKYYKDLFVEAMQETLLLSKKFKINFNYNPINNWLERIHKMPKDLTSSMFLDFKKNKKLELDWLSGYVTRLCDKYSISCEANKKILNGIKSK